jgi:alkylhydroperoxidase family enzyme
VSYLSDGEFLSKDPEAAERIMERRKGRLLNLDRVLMHSPAVAKGWNALFGALRSGLSLPGRLRELVICRIAVLNRAYYEFYQHQPVLLQEGGRPEEALALGRWRDSPLFDRQDRAVLAYVDEMTTRVQVGDATARAAAEALGSQQKLVEVTALCGGYNLVSRFLEALQLTPETHHDLPAMP